LDGNEETATEWPVLIKSTADRYDAVESAIRERHPYSVPEIIAWPIARGLPAYLGWVEQESSPK
jgi:periplasmic divalent cation tolerance protein